MASGGGAYPSPVLVGDEVAASRWSRHWRRVRSQVRIAFFVGVVALAALLNLLHLQDLTSAAVTFGALSLVFMLAFLAAGARMAMKPMEVYEEGVHGTQLGMPLGRRVFVRWREVRGIALPSEGRQKDRLRLDYGRRGCLVSAPGEFSPKALEAIEARRAASAPERREEEAARGAIASARGEVTAVGRAGIDTADFEEQLDAASGLLSQGRFLDAATRAVATRSAAHAAARGKLDAAIEKRAAQLAADRASGINTDAAEAELSRARRLIRPEGTDWAAALEAATGTGGTRSPSPQGPH